MTTEQIVERAKQWVGEHRAEVMYHLVTPAETAQGSEAHLAAMSAHMRAIEALEAEIADPTCKAAATRAIVRAAAIAASEQAARANNPQRLKTHRQMALKRALECEARAIRVINLK